MKKVSVFTGSRANYSSCKSIMRAIQKHPELELQVVLGAAAVLDRYGNIENLVKRLPKLGLSISQLKLWRKRLTS